MADGNDDKSLKNNPLYDVPKKPEVTPRTRVPGSVGSGASTTTETPLKPLVPPKRRNTASSVKHGPSSTSEASSTTPKSAISVAEVRQKLEQGLKDSTQPQKELSTVAPKVPTPVKVNPPAIPTKPPVQNQPKPPPSIPQSPGAPTVDSTAKSTSSRYVEVGTAKFSVDNDIPEAPDYADPDAFMTRSSTSSQPGPGNMEYTEPMLVIKSKPFGLEEFATEFPLPQIVRVYTGHYGITEQFSMSEGEELILFFIKSAKIVMASTQKRTETYHLPLNSSLQFGPYYAKSAEGETHSYHYDTVEDLLKREEGLPKVVKVFKTYSGSSEEQSVRAGDLIFPQKVSGKKKGKVLKCKTKYGTKLKLGLNCAGDFSTDPSDVRMYLLEYIEYVNEFPVMVLVFNDKDDYNSKLSSLRTGTVLILDAPAPLRSYICSTDIFGERDYPIIELPMIMPIQIQSMERPGLDMQPIYSKIQHAYENFDLSMVKKSMFPAQNERELKVQQQFYEEIKRDDGNSHLYDLERPEAIYEAIPGDAFDKKEIKPPRPILPSKPVTPQRPAPLPPPVKSPPLPPPLKSPPLPPMNQTSPKPIEGKSFPPPLPTRPTTTPPTRSTTTPATQPTTAPATRPTTTPATRPTTTPASPVANPSKAVPATPPPDKTQVTSPKTNVIIVKPSNEKATPKENQALLKVMTGEDILLLLDNMNLGEYKDGFQREQVDGELMLELTKSDLEDLGITKNIHQIRLLKLIDGSSSVKKYADGLYGTLS